METIAQANIIGPDILIIVGVVVLLFGGSKLPELAKGLGQSMKEFKKAVHEDPEEEKKVVEKAPEKPVGTPE